MIRAVFHPTDFTVGSELAFAHALAIALGARSDLTIYHATARELELTDWREFPAVRGTLERWGLLEGGSERDAVFERLGVAVKKVAGRAESPLLGILDYLEKHPVDLVVLATHGHDGLGGWLRTRVAEPLVRAAATPALFVRHGVRGFVELANGAVGLRRVLIPVDREPRPQAAVDAALELAQAVGGTPERIELIHVGPPGDMPTVDVSAAPATKWERISRRGDVVDAIAAAAGELEADLIAMSTAGHDGFLDALRGSTTERVLRRAPCPVLAVPVTDLRSAG
ncbi:MAG TPA: universal stress protein [Candidatus Methylomirabilis sp.]|nr:universal stress protein [Candidatus Methylomirabilis sp.]